MNRLSSAQGMYIHIDERRDVGKSPAAQARPPDIADHRVIARRSRSPSTSMQAAEIRRHEPLAQERHRHRASTWEPHVGRQTGTPQLMSAIFDASRSPLPRRPGNLARRRAFAARLNEVSEHAAIYVELAGANHAFDVFPSVRSLRTVEYVERFLSAVRNGTIK